MEIERLDSEALCACLKAGCDCLELNRDLLDNLNVFPVPDGDTGVNMVSTLKPAVAELATARCRSLREVSEVMSAALFRNSRGNSGFILAQFFRGFWDVAGTCDCLEPESMWRGFERGSFAAVSSLLSPVEGTMITIIASMARAMKHLDSRNLVSYLDAAIEAGVRSLYRTPELLPLLAEAGVVDAGALGFLFIVKGMRCALLNQEVEAEDENRFRLAPLSGGTSNRIPRTEFRYCVEVEIETGRRPPDDFTELLLQFGDSIALIADDDRMRVHIHTNLPEALIERMGGYGKVVHSKLDDMREQIAGNGGIARGVSPAGTQCSVPVLSIIPGPGFRALFEELGASDCLEYRETLPSAEDVLNAIDRMRGEEVILLPNNPNIIPTARLVEAQTGKHVHILRTRSVVEGLTAMYGYSESDSARVNMSNMRDGIGLAQTLEVYRSSRDTTFGRFRIRKGHYFVVRGDLVLSADHSLEDSVVTAMQDMDVADRSHLSFYYADDFDVPRLEGIKERISGLNPHLEFEEHYGGQRKGVLIVSLE